MLGATDKRLVHIPRRDFNLIKKVAFLMKCNTTSEPKEACQRSTAKDKSTEWANVRARIPSKRKSRGQEEWGS